MKDPDGVQFLQWCLPRLRLRWPGFRKVRRRVYKCIDRRLRQLGLADVSEYRRYLERDAGEWRALDACCRIPISRFYRDRAVFASLEEEVLPRLAETASARHEQRLQCWSIGSASGEEPYTLSILWRIRIAPRFPGLGLRVLATDVDTHALERARRGCYGRGSLKDLPADLLARAFTPSPQGLCVKPEYREGVEFFQQDVRLTMPPGPFHLVFCRNLAFTYFEAALQREILGRITERLCPGGALVIGSLESLPAEVAGLEPWSGRRAVYRRSAPDPGGRGARSPASPTERTANAPPRAAQPGPASA